MAKRLAHFELFRLSESRSHIPITKPLGYQYYYLEIFSLISGISFLDECCSVFYLVGWYGIAALFGNLQFWSN